MGFCSQEYWSGLPFPSLGDLPHLGNDPGFPALQADSLLSELPGKPRKNRMVLLLQKKFHILSNYKMSTFCLIIHTHWYTHTSSNSFYHPPQQHTWSLIQKNSSTDDGGYELTISWWQSRNFQRNFRCACMLTCVQLFVTPWIVAHPRSSVHGISQARILEWVHVLLQGIFPTPESNLGLLHCRQIPYHWASWEAPNFRWLCLYMHLSSTVVKVPTLESDRYSYRFQFWYLIAMWPLIECLPAW